MYTTSNIQCLVHQKECEMTECSCEIAIKIMSKTNNVLNDDFFMLCMKMLTQF